MARIKHLEPQLVAADDLRRVARKLIDRRDYPFRTQLAAARLCPRCEREGTALVADMSGRVVGRMEVWGSCRGVGRART